MIACADMNAHVRSRAAHDLACSKDQTRIEDVESGVYRVSGCGMTAGYQCSDGASFAAECNRLYVSKTPDPAAPKASAAQGLAKAR
jgi:hypothetical protein